MSGPAPLYLVEITARVSGEEKTLRYSTHGYVTAPTDTPANTVYEKYLLDPGVFVRSLHTPERTMGNAETDFGYVELSNVSGALDFMLASGFAVDGRSIVIKRLAAKTAMFASAEVVLRATMTEIESSDATKQIRVKIYDRRLELEKPLLTNRYSGVTVSGGLSGDNLIEGDANLKGTVKPKVWGRVLDITPPRVNYFDQIFQVNDGPVSAIQAYCGGVALVNAGDFATLDLLNANKGSLTMPKYATCLARGVFQVYGAIDKPITADVTEGSTLTMRYIGGVLMRMLASVGLSGSANINTASFQALNTAVPAELGIYVDDDTQILEAVESILASVGAWMSPNATGQFEVGRITIGTPAWTLVDPQMIESGLSFGLNPDSDNGLPIWRVTVKHRKNWSRLSENEIAPSVSNDRKSFLLSEWRETQATQSSVQTTHPLAKDLTCESLLLSPTDAATEAARKLALYSVDRHLLRVSVPRDEASSITLGSTGTVRMTRLGYGSGRTMVCIGRTEEFAANTVRLTLWG